MNGISSSPVGEYGPDYEGLEGGQPTVDNFRKVSLIPLVFLIFYEVSGGPFGIEDSVNATGPLLALIGFLVFPFIWSIPEALITAEMGTMFPENGGYVVWVSTALGPYWGFQQGWMKWLSGVIDNALYPVLFLDYIKSTIPALEGGYPRVLAILVLTVLLTYMNYRGLTIVGWVAVFLGVFSLLPFAVMSFATIPKLKPSRWFVVDLHSVNWNLYLNTLFWNLNYWDSISTLAGEMEKVPMEEVEKKMISLGISVEAINGLLQVLALKSLPELEDALGSAADAVADLKQLFSLAEQYGYSQWIQFDASIVRGLSYYTGVVFEGFDREGKLRAICGGGRYDQLLSTFGGTDTPACGFGFGDAVIVELLKEKGLLPDLNPEVDDIVFPIDQQLQGSASMITSRLRQKGRSVDLVLEQKRLKWIFKHAERIKASRLILVGKTEWERGMVRVKNLSTREEQDVKVDELN